MKKNIRVLLKVPGQLPVEAELPNTLKALQHAVGGYIEAYHLTRDLCLLCCEEGRLRGYPANFRMLGVTFVGPVVICGTKGADFADLPADWETMRKLFPALFREGAEKGVGT